MVALLPLRLSFFYICVFMVIGIMLPYWPVWLKSRGLDSFEIGVLTAVPILGKMIFSPIFASLGDRFGRRKPLMLSLIFLAGLSYACFGVGADFTTIFVISVLYGMFWAPIMSFGDNITLLSTRDSDIQYGRLRLWGSLSFIAMSFGAGFMLERHGVSVIYIGILTAIILTFGASMFLPDVRLDNQPRAKRPVQTLLSQKMFVCFLLCVALTHGSHALYYGFATLHWQSLGYQDSTIGFLWSLAVFAEVIFFVFGTRLGETFSASGMLLMAASASGVRWLVLSFDPSFELLLIVQCLHALSFGAMHLGAMMFISNRISLDLSISAQSLYGAAAFGLGTGLSLLFVGLMYDLWGVKAYFIMTLMGIGGTLFALVLRKKHQQIDRSLQED